MAYFGEGGLKKDDVRAMGRPSCRPVPLPLRRTSVIVPEVVGIQLIVTGCPAFMLNPLAGIWKGFWSCA